MYIVLVYDIDLETGGAKVLRSVFKTCKKFLNHIQNSVFEGEISDAQFMAMKLELKKNLREGIDSCIVFKGRNNKWMEKEFIIKEEDNTGNFL